jgi:hypothetical protein
MDDQFENLLLNVNFSVQNFVVANTNFRQFDGYEFQRVSNQLQSMIETLENYPYYIHRLIIAKGIRCKAF